MYVFKLRKSGDFLANILYNLAPESRTDVFRGHNGLWTFSEVMLDSIPGTGPDSN